MSSEQPISGSTAPVKHGEGHGGPARGYKWKDFEPGNLAAVKHGAQSLILLKPRAAEIADAIREAKGDAWSEEFTPAAEVAALALARVERALGFLLELDEATIEENFSRLDDRAKGWARLALQSLEALSMTPKVSAADGGGPTTFIVVSAFPGARPVAASPRADVTLDTDDVRELPEEASAS